MATLFDLRNADLDSLLKTQLIQLCKDYGLPTGGLKSSLVAPLLTLRSQLPPLPASSTATANAGSQQAFGFPLTASAGLPATLAAASLSAGGVPRLPAPSTHAGPGLQPSDLHIMAQQAAQQAAARVLAHFVPPSASASTAALRHRVLAALQPGLFRWHLPNSPAAAGIHGSPAVFWPQCHHCNLTVMGLPASLSLSPA